MKTGLLAGPQRQFHDRSSAALENSHATKNDSLENKSDGIQNPSNLHHRYHEQPLAISQVLDLEGTAAQSRHAFARHRPPSEGMLGNEQASSLTETAGMPSARSTEVLHTQMLPPSRLSTEYPYSRSEMAQHLSQISIPAEQATVQRSPPTDQIPTHSSSEPKTENRRLGPPPPLNPVTYSGASERPLTETVPIAISGSRQTAAPRKFAASVLTADPVSDQLIKSTKVPGSLNNLVVDTNR